MIFKNNIKTRTLIFGFSVIFLLGSSFLIQGQSLQEIDTIQVTTTRLPLQSKETGRNISIVKGTDIQKMAITSLDELLQVIPGIEVQTRNGFGAQGDISMRGATYTQIQVLVNGMKLNDPLTGHFNSYIPVSPVEIERVEVLRGAASAMYGADAVGGVINIITKGFKPEEEIAIKGTINYGANKLLNTQHGIIINKGRFYATGGFAMNQSDGQIIEEQIVGDETLEAYNNFFDIKTAGLSFGYQFNNEWRLQARTSYDVRDFSARYFYTTSTFDKSVETTSNWWNQIQISKIGQQNSTDFNIAYRKGQDEFIFSPDFPSTNVHSTDFLNFTLNHLKIVNDVFSLKTGGQLDKRAIESTDRGDHSDWHYGVYTSGVYQPNPQLNVVASLRLDYDDNYELEFTPQLNLSYLLSNMTLRASVGRSIRAADYTERYVSFNLQNLTPGRSLGNPDLVAEAAWSQEVGLDYRLTKNWELKTTLFARQSSNLIDYVPTNEAVISRNQNLRTGENYLYASNITNVDTRGVEVESWIRTTLDNNMKLQWSLGYTYINTSNEEDIVSVYIASHARHLINTNLLLTYKKVDIAINGLYKARNEQFAAGINARLSPNYQVWNLRLGYQLLPKFGLNLQVQNVFDESYQNILGAAMPNRWLMGGIKYAF